MHDVVDPYPGVPKPPDTLERSLQRLTAEMARRRAVADEAITAAEQIMREQTAKDPMLAAKQARLLEVLRNRASVAPPADDEAGQHD